jgi:hypothetical protein
MLKCKPVLKAAAAALLFVNSSSFTEKKANAIYYYKSGTPYQRLESGHIKEADPRERSITFKSFTDTNNWTTEEQGSSTSSTYNFFIYSISFDEELTADGGSDGQLTLQEAIYIVYARYTATESQINEYNNISVGNENVNVVAIDEVR